MLAEVVDDVKNQTIRAPHLVTIDNANEGPARLRNIMVRAAETPWVAFVDDDDRLREDHLEQLLLASPGADVVYSLGSVTGRDWEIPHDCSLKTLDSFNTIPITALVRRSAFIGAGGFHAEKNEDHALWLRIRDNGGVFRCVHETTWLYRFHGENRSLKD